MYAFAVQILYGGARGQFQWVQRKAVRDFLVSARPELLHGHIRQLDKNTTMLEDLIIIENCVKS